MKTQCFSLDFVINIAFFHRGLYPSELHSKSFMSNFWGALHLFILPTIYFTTSLAVDLPTFTKYIPACNRDVGNIALP